MLVNTLRWRFFIIFPLFLTSYQQPPTAWSTDLYVHCMYNAVACMASGFVWKEAMEESRSERPSHKENGAKTMKIVQCCTFLVISLLIFNFVLARQTKGRVQGVHTSPWDDLWHSNTTAILQNMEIFMICFMLLPSQKPPSSYSLIKFVYQSVTPFLSGACDNMEQLHIS